MPAVKRNNHVKTKACPICGCDMVHTHPKKQPSGQVQYYRRWTCTSCDHYESCTYKVGKPKGRTEISAVEMEERRNQNADKYFPKDYTLLKKQTSQSKY